jgi:hypothetical protein
LESFGADKWVPPECGRKGHRFEAITGGGRPAPSVTRSARENKSLALKNNVMVEETNGRRRLLEGSRRGSVVRSLEDDNHH